MMVTEGDIEWSKQRLLADFSLAAADGETELTARNHYIISSNFWQYSGDWECARECSLA